MPLANRNKPSDAEGAESLRAAGFPVHFSNEAIVRALVEGRGVGGAALYDRYHRHVRRVLARILGPTGEVTDLVQDAFLEAVRSIGRLQDPDALPGWLTTIAVRVATAHIKRRVRLRWFPLFANEDLPEVEAASPSPEVDAAARATYDVLSRLSADERVAFALRYVDGMELADVARACGISLATAKRRIARAQKRFVAIARSEPDLQDWMRGGARWT